MSAIARPLAAGFFESGIPDANLSIQFNLDVMGRLSAAVTEGFKAVPRRGLEIGGVLLGRVENNCVTVEDFEAVDSEHQRGPSWLLSEKDKGLLSEAVSRANQAESGTRVVGLFRSQTRAGFAPTEDDAALLEEHCPGGVFLLVKPEPGGRNTAFFAAGHGLRAVSETFPFRGGSAVASGPQPVAAPRPVAAPLPPVAPPPAAEPALVEHVHRLSMARVMEGLEADHERTPVSPDVSPDVSGDLSADLSMDEPGSGLWSKVAWTLAILLCAGVGGYGFARWWTSRPPVDAASGQSMALHVNWSGTSLDLQWNRDSPLIRQANRGVLWIEDGAQHRHLELKAEQLTQGSIQYWPTSSDVDFKLEVFTPRGSSSESIRALSVPLPPVAVTPVTAAPAPPAPAPSIRPAATHAAPKPFTTVEFEAIVRKQGVAPKPLHRAVPAVSAELRRSVKEPVEVDIKVDIDAAGKVRRTELVSKRQDSRGHFEGLARGASYAWTFVPARSGDRRVPSTAILHYRFGNS